MTLRILSAAEIEIDLARRYLNEQLPGLGLRFLDDLADKLEAIESRPSSFAKLETLRGDHPYRRALLSTFPYVVVFEVLDAEILVVAIANASREPNYWLGR